MIDMGEKRSSAMTRSLDCGPANGEKRRSMSPAKILMDFTKFSNIVNGEARGGNAFYQGIDPTTRQKLWDVPVATHQDVDDAVQAAQEAFKSWSTTPIAKRKEICAKFGQLYQSHIQDFDFLIRKECGKPVSCSNLATGLVPDLT